MAFGSGVLLSAVSFELVAEASEIGGGTFGVLFGFFGGAAAFTLGDILIGRFQRRRQGMKPASSEEGSGLSILLGALLDGVPETAVLGLTVLQTGRVGLAMLAAVFISNLPEGIAATTTLIESGWKRTAVLRDLGGRGSGVRPRRGRGVRSSGRRTGRRVGFRLRLCGWGGAHHAATSMIPEAYERAGRPGGFLTVFGFFVGHGISVLEG